VAPALYGRYPIEVVPTPWSPLFDDTLASSDRQMRTISCLIWILITLLTTASLDRVPDPPAASPAGAQLTISVPHELPPAFGAPSVGLAPSQMQEPEHLAVLDAAETLQSIHWIDSLERETDPSPPPSIS
jgi:hypothetical protein